MNVILLLILISLMLATGFLLGFIWAVRSGQYEDACTPAMRMLLEDRHHSSQHNTSSTDSAPSRK